MTFLLYLVIPPPMKKNDDPLFKISTTQGESRVICFSPDHSKTLPQLTIPENRTDYPSMARTGL